MTFWSYPQGNSECVRALAAWNTNFETVAQEYPIKRIVQADEIAKTVLWLSSADPTCVVGIDIDITGGYLMYTADNYKRMFEKSFRE